MLQFLPRNLIKILLLLILVLLLAAAFDVRLKTAVYHIDSYKVSRPVTLALLTDLHSCRYGDGQQQLISAIDSQKPDIILLGGDIFDEDMPHDNAKTLLSSLTDRYPCYYVTGNHEYSCEDFDELMSWLAENNINRLSGEAELLNIDGQLLNICGVDDPEIVPYTGDEQAYTQQLSALQNTWQNGCYTVLLAHRPDRIEEYLTHNMDLAVCGHAHGGQWRIPLLLNGLLAPHQGLFPQYAGGEYELSNGQMIVSRGLARESTRIPRIFNRPELVIIKLS